MKATMHKSRTTVFAEVHCVKPAERNQEEPVERIALAARANQPDEKAVCYSSIYIEPHCSIRAKEPKSERTAHPSSDPGDSAE